MKPDNKHPFCPCCSRVFANEDEAMAFRSQTKSLYDKENSVLLEGSDADQAAINSYTQWKDVVSKSLPGTSEYRRLANETKGLKSDIDEMTIFVNQKNAELDNLASQEKSLEEDVQESRGLLEQTRQFAGAASRIAEKRMQVKQKQLDLSASAADIAGRDLKTVERQLKEKISGKDNNSTKVSVPFCILKSIVQLYFESLSWTHETAQSYRINS